MVAVVIVGINYWPETTGIAPYTTAMAEALAIRHRVTVITGLPHYPGWAVQPGHGGLRQPVQVHNDVTILRRWHYVPDRQSALHRAAYELTFAVTASGPVRGRRADVVVGIVPSLGGGIAARLLAARWNRPLGLVMQDLVAPAAAQSGITGGERVASATRLLERWLVGGAARVAIVADSFRPYLTSLDVRDERITHLPNWTHVRVPAAIDREAERRRIGWAADDFIVLHAGNMGLKQGLEQIVDAATVAAERAPRVRFVLLGDGSQRSRLARLAGGRPNIELRPPVDERAFVPTLAAADVLLLSERPTVRDMSLPSKLTSYFSVGLPVVAAVRPDGASAAEVRRAEAGLVVPAGDAEALVGALDRLQADGELRNRLGRAGRAYAARALDSRAALERAEAFIERVAAERSGRNHRHG